MMLGTKLTSALTASSCFLVDQAGHFGSVIDSAAVHKISRITMYLYDNNDSRR